MKVCFDLGNDLYEHGELSLDGLSSVKQLRSALLHLADEVRPQVTSNPPCISVIRVVPCACTQLLIDPDDDLGDWKLSYTHSKTGNLEVCDAKTSFATVKCHAAELRVTAERARSE